MTGVIDTVYSRLTMNKALSISLSVVLSSMVSFGLSGCERRAAATINNRAWQAVIKTDPIVADEKMDEAESLDDRGIKLVADGRYDEAWETFSKALRLKEKRFGPADASLIGTLHEMTEYPFATERGDPVARLIRLADLRAKVLGRDSADALQTVLRICAISQMIGGESEAIKFLKKSDAPSDTALRHFVITACLSELYAKIGERDRAIVYLRTAENDASSIDEPRLPDDLRYVSASAFMRLGRAARSAGLPVAGCGYLERSVADYRSLSRLATNNSVYVEAVAELVETYISASKFTEAEKTLAAIRSQLNQRAQTQWSVQFCLLSAQINDGLRRPDNAQLELQEAKKLCGALKDNAGTLMKIRRYEARRGAMQPR
jgi:tetratricopeptide (TPR) repeat protein